MIPTNTIITPETLSTQTINTYLEGITLPPDKPKQHNPTKTKHRLIPHNLTCNTHHTTIVHSKNILFFS